MRSKLKRLARRQLNDTLEQLQPLKDVNPPLKGWVRAIRETLGMTGEQLARRLQTNKQRVSRIERDEIEGRLTVNTLKNVAKALDCDFVYALVPKQGLDRMIQDRATQLAQRRFQRSSRMMQTEQHGISQQEKLQILQEMVYDIMDDMPKALWEDYS